jgi:DNA-binding beta-propeller fold protein YncE
MQQNSDGQFIKAWGQGGTRNGEFQAPIRIAVDPNDSIYVVDRDNHRVQKFNPNGVFIKNGAVVQNLIMYGILDTTPLLQNC